MDALPPVPAIGSTAQEGATALFGPSVTARHVPLKVRPLPLPEGPPTVAGYGAGRCSTQGPHPAGRPPRRGGVVFPVALPGVTGAMVGVAIGLLSASAHPPRRCIAVQAVGRLRQAHGMNVAGPPDGSQDASIRSAKRRATDGNPSTERASIRHRRHGDPALPHDDPPGIDRIRHPHAGGHQAVAEASPASRSAGKPLPDNVRLRERGTWRSLEAKWD